MTAPPKKTDKNKDLDDLLYRWHDYCRTYNMTKGYAPCAAGCNNWKSSKQYDTDTTTHGDNLDAAQVVEFDEFMDKLHADHELYYIAICQDAKNIYSGVSTFSHPKMPKGEEGKITTAKARARVIAEFLG